MSSGTRKLDQPGRLVSGHRTENLPKRLRFVSTITLASTALVAPTVAAYAQQIVVGPGSPFDNGGTPVAVTTNSPSTDALWVQPGGVVDLSQGSMSLSTSGVNSRGIYADRGTVTVGAPGTSNTSTIETSGTQAYGILASNSFITASGLDIATHGSSAFGILATGATTSVTLNDVSILTTAAGGYGLSVEHGAVLSKTGGSIKTQSGSSFGVNISNSTASLTDVDVLSGNSMAISVSGHASLTLTNSQATAVGMSTMRLLGATNNPATADISGSTLLARTNAAGQGGYGIDVNDNAILRLSNSSVENETNNQHGIWFATKLTGSTITDSTITTHGDGARGVLAIWRDASAGPDALSIALTGGEIRTYGANAYGLQTQGVDSGALLGARVAITGTHIVTAGNVGVGIAAFEQSRVDAANVTIETGGVSAYGIYTGQLAGITMNGGSITTRNLNAAGAYAPGGSMSISNAGILTSGDNAFGVRVDNSAGYGSNVVLDNDSILTEGAGAHGVVVGFGGAASISGTTIATTGANAAGLYLLGATTDTHELTIANSSITAADGPGVLVRGADNMLQLEQTDILGLNGTLFDIRRRLVPGSDPATPDDANPARLTVVATGGHFVGAARPDDASTLNVTLNGGAQWTITTAAADEIAPAAALPLTVSRVDDLTLNGSTLAFAAPTSGDFKTLVVSGNYIGNGGTIVFNTALGDDNSPSDRLHVMGDTSGQTTAVVRNAGGIGAYTVNGIRLIQVDGASNGRFSLLGDYVTKDSRPAVVAGAYAYTLEKNGIADPTDGNWYLRSQLIPTKPVDPGEPVKPAQPELYQPGVPLYEAYPQVLQALNGLPTLQQRVGNRYWNGSGVDRAAAGFASNRAGQTSGTGFWGRVEGVQSRMTPAFSTSSTSYDVDTFKLQAGLDGQLYESATGRLIGGLTLHYGSASANVRSLFGDGRINTDGYGFGGTLTWYGANGFYVDGQAQTTWYDSGLNSRLAGRRLVSGNDGFGYALSVETGQRIALNPNWTLTPQAQLIHSKISFDSFTDPFDARVSLDHADSLRGRLGLALDYEQAWRSQDGTKSRSHVYGIANLHREFGNGTRVDVAGTGFASRNDRLWGGLGLGGSFNWKDDKFLLYGEVTTNTSLGSCGNSYAFSGTAGLRVRF